MKYEKPEVVVLAKAVNAIQGVHKGGTTVDSQPIGTTPAYEADE
jgi:hypothetical protein